MPPSSPTPSKPDASAVLNVIGIITDLEPIGFALVQALITKIEGKSDAEILAEDSATLGNIVATAHAELGQ